jgi:ferritin-like metal-binding protein YciE
MIAMCRILAWHLWHHVIKSRQWRHSMSEDQVVPQQEELLRITLIDALAAADALEQQSVAILEQHEWTAQETPEIEMRLREHLGHTYQHRERLAERLCAYGQEPTWEPDIADALAPAFLLGVHSGTLARHVVDAYLIEHRQIAAYVLLSTFAQVAGDEATAQMCVRNLQDDLLMAHHLQQHVVEAAMLALQHVGVAPSPMMHAVAQRLTPLLSQTPSGDSGDSSTHGVV